MNSGNLKSCNAQAVAEVGVGSLPSINSILQTTPFSGAVWKHNIKEECTQTLILEEICCLTESPNDLEIQWLTGHPVLVINENILGVSFEQDVERY